MNNYSKILNMLAEAPSDVCDPSVLPRLKALADSDDPTANSLHDILDDCVFSSLCSDFMIDAMDRVWRGMLADEGRTVEQAVREKHDTRLEYHEIRALSQELSENASPKFIARLADLSRLKAEAAYKQGVEDGRIATEAVMLTGMYVTKGFK